MINEKYLEKAKAAKSAEELLAIAKENGLTLTEEQAAEYFDKLNVKSGELADDELDNVAGGGCGDEPTPQPKFVAGERVMLDELMFVMDSGSFGVSTMSQVPGTVLRLTGTSAKGEFYYEVKYDGYTSRTFELWESAIHKM